MDPNEDQDLDNVPDQNNDEGTDNGTDNRDQGVPEDGDDSNGGGENQNPADPNSPNGEDEGDDEDLEDDDDLDDFAPPGFTPNSGGAQQPGTGATPLDIRTLPRDANGAIVPDQANAKIEEYVQQRINQAQQAFSQDNETVAKTREKLTTDWQKGFQKFPAVAKSKDYATYARDLHLRSIEDYKNGTGPYISPIAAMKKADRMLKKAAKSGYQSAKTRRRVERAGTPESSGGKSSQGKQVSPYESARKKALSSNPDVAREGREEIMKLRRAARNS